MLTADRLKASTVLLARGWRFVRAVAARFAADACPLHAAALAYSTLLSLVPLLALMFAVFKGLGLQWRLEPLLLSRLSLSPEVTARILTYIDRTNVKTLGVVGALALLTSVISVLGGMERSFNHIWRVRHGRTWWRRLTDYGATVLLTPFLLLAGTVLTSTLHVRTLVEWAAHTGYSGPAVLLVLRLVPLAINTVALATLYAIMPNRRPDVRAIAVGAIVAGCGWQVVQWAYVVFQIGAADYNAIYGALAQLPVTLVWLYVSWTVVLAGAELAALTEFGTEGTDTTPPPAWLVALALLLSAAEHFRAGDASVLRVAQLARAWRLDPARAATIAEDLCEAQLLAAVRDAAGSYVLARAPETIELAPLIDRLDDRLVVPRREVRLNELLQRLLAARCGALAAGTLADLMDKPRS